MTNSSARLVLLDTDALIDYSKGIVDSVAFIDGIDRGGGVLCICSIVAAEFETSLAPVLLPRVEPYLNALTYLPTSRSAARQAGRWRYEFRGRGVPLALTDSLIAATAQEHGSQLVTANVRDYPMQGVAVLALPRAQR